MVKRRLFKRVFTLLDENKQRKRIGVIVSAFVGLLSSNFYFMPTYGGRVRRVLEHYLLTSYSRSFSNLQNVCPTFSCILSSRWVFEGDLVRLKEERGKSGVSFSFVAVHSVPIMAPITCCTISFPGTFSPRAIGFLLLMVL